MDERKNQVRHIFQEFVQKELETRPDFLVTRSNPNSAPSPVLEFCAQYLRFAYFLRLLPYKIAKLEISESDPSEPKEVRSSTFEYTVQTTVTQKIITVITNFLALYAYLNYSRTGGQHTNMITPSLLSFLETIGFTLMHKCIFFLSFRQNSGSFLALFQHIDRHAQQVDVPNSAGSAKERLKLRSLATILCLLYAFLAVICVFVGHRLLPIREWSPINLVNRTAQFTKVMVFLPTTTEPQLEWVDYFLSFIQICIQFWNQLASFYADLIIMMLGLTYASICTKFARFLKGEYANGDGDSNGQSSRVNVKALLRSFDEVQTIAGRITQIGESIIIASWLEMTYYAFQVNELVGADQDWFVKARYLCFLSAQIVFWCLVAWATNALECAVFAWIHHEENRRQMTCTQLTVLVNELSRHRVSVSPKGLVPITYGFIGKATSAIVTYAIIVYQLKQH